MAIPGGTVTGVPPSGLFCLGAAACVTEAGRPRSGTAGADAGTCAIGSCLPSLIRVGSEATDAGKTLLRLAGAGAGAGASGIPLPVLTCDHASAAEDA